MSGKRLHRPDNCTNELYDIMMQCWHENPDERPDFKNLVKRLEPAQQKIYIDFEELDPNYVFPPLNVEN